jgi:hypothetical protein
MTMDRIQFQAGLSMGKSRREYGTHESCEAVWFASRWPSGWTCPRYACTHNGRRLWECLECADLCPSMVGRVLEHTKLLPGVWFLVICLMTQIKKAISAL